MTAEKEARQLAATVKHLWGPRPNEVDSFLATGEGRERARGACLRFFNANQKRRVAADAPVTEGSRRAAFAFSATLIATRPLEIDVSWSAAGLRCDPDEMLADVREAVARATAT